MTDLVYRVENQNTMQGLWYDKDGNYNPFIKRLTNAKSAHLPMGFDPVYKHGGAAWYSGCDNLPDMLNWFNFQDVVELQQAGYKLYAFELSGYQQVPGHVIFTRESVIECHEADINILKPV